MPPLTPAKSCAPPKLPEIYYDSGRKNYWTRNSRGDWIEVGEGTLRRLLRANGHSRITPSGEELSPLDGILNRLTCEADVAFAGPLAGHPAGVTECCGQRLLVTSAPRLIVPMLGMKWPTLERLLDQQFPDGQLPYVLGWLKCAVEALTTREFRPGQMLALAGGAGVGKSLFQNLVTEILGGRSAKPYRYMTGNTQFNSELFGAEHLAIEDEAASTDIRTRRDFGANLKNLIVNETQSYHAKGRNALTLRCFWRVTISLNDEPENLMVLPPLDESLRDKIMLIQVGRPDFPEAEDNGARRAFRTRLTLELPGFLGYLKRWRIPASLRDGRYGVKAYQHPELVEMLDTLSPEHRLLGLIDSASLANGEPWEGTAEELEKAIRQHDGFSADRVFNYSSAAGVYLSRLRAKRPERVSCRWLSGKRLWSIQKA